MQDMIPLVVERHFPDARLGSMERLTGGVSADVFRLNLYLPNGTTLKVVLRCHGETHSGHDADLEFCLLQSLFEIGLPVPKPLYADTSRELLGRPYLLIAFIHGCPITQQAVLDSDDEYIEKMAEALVTVHNKATDALPALPQRTDPLPELLDYLPTTADFRELRNHLLQLENTAYNAMPSLLHGDFWPANLVWQEDRITGMLDWEDAAIGDPLSDVACTCLELRYICGKKGMRRFQQAYSQYRPVDDHRLALWLIYVAAAALHSMGNWGLEISRETEMRRTAIKTINEAAAVIM